MILAEKIFVLRSAFPFSRLKPEELLVIATAATLRTLPPGRLVTLPGGTLHHLFIRVEGDLVNDAGTPLQHVLGTTPLLTGCTVPIRIQAGPAGYRGLCLPRGKFLTIVNECPSLLVGFFEMPLLGLAGPAFPPPSS